MFIFLDNSEEGKTIFWTISGKKTTQFIFQGARVKRGLLVCFDELIKNKKIVLKKIAGIGMRVGSGRFTSTRIAATFGNILSYFLHKPIVGLVDFTPELFLQKIRKAKAGIYLSAKYSGQANIGKNKKI